MLVLSRTLVDAYDEFRDADREWSDLLRDTFGADAPIARYQMRGRGEPGTALAAAWVRREAARTVFEAVQPVCAQH